MCLNENDIALLAANFSRCFVTMDQHTQLSTAPLYKFWQRTGNVLDGISEPIPPHQWSEEVHCLSQHGRGTEEALRFLYTEKPSFEVFTDWLQASRPEPLVVPAGAISGNVLTAADHEFWTRNGYLVVRNAVSAADCAAARNAIWEYLGASPSDPESWYQPHSGKNGMMLSFFQHPALDNNRNSLRIRKAYEELYGSEDIYLLLDKVSFNPPETDNFKFRGSPLHWDVSLQLPVPFVLQGLLYLNDVDAAEGAFHCVPGFHDHIGSWLAEVPDNEEPRTYAAKTLKPVPVPGSAGDLVIWHQALPHCATPNTGTQPRMVQYIAWKPVNKDDQAIWK